MAEPMLVEIVDGIAEYLHFDEASGRFGIQRVADVEAIIDQNKARQNDGTGGWSPSRELRHAASIPTPVALKWLEEGIDVFNKDHWPAVRKKLNDPDYRFLRVGLGRI